MIHTHDQFHDLEQEERLETTFIGLRYIGDRNTMLPRRPRRRGGWPGNAIFQGGDPGGPIQFGIVPDVLGDGVEGGDVSGLESLADFEVIYDPAELAAEILAKNSLPVAAFGGDRKTPDYEVRDVVYRRLGLDDRGRQAPEAEAELRAALAEIAGIDDPATDETAEVQSRADDLVDTHSRPTLMSVAADLDADVDGRLNAATKRDLADAIVEFSPATVREAVDTVTDDE